MSPTLNIGLLALACQGVAPAAVAGVPPAQLAGIWDVEKVAVDAQDAQHWEMRPDDPLLLGRTLVINADRVQFEEGKEIGCKQSSWQPRKTSWGVLFAKSFPRPAMGGRSASPVPKDFDIDVAAKDVVTAYSLCPGKRGPFPTDAWVVLRGPERLALHYDNQVLLILRRRRAGAAPTASFDCAKAAAPSEKTICNSFDLASWDRSVTLAFKRALERQPPDKQAALRKSQREWLRNRDACKTDAACIDELQWRRVEELRQE